ETWALTSYKRAFSSYFGNAQYSFAAAWAVLLVIIGVSVSLILLWKFRFNELVEEPKIDSI
ncbi:MAG: sugar ABC transporter permease, partial [Chloroflexi bacterium]|nr:sugar ABC transporter permease [Chloroflexota bacterium]